jgi:hypothetical protein
MTGLPNDILINRLIPDRIKVIIMITEIDLINGTKAILVNLRVLRRAPKRPSTIRLVI